MVNEWNIVDPVEIKSEASHMDYQVMINNGSKHVDFSDRYPVKAVIRKPNKNVPTWLVFDQVMLENKVTGKIFTKK